MKSKIFVRLGLLAAILILVCATVSVLRAQDSPPAKQPPPKPAQQSAEPHRGPAQEIVHESNEAAGEEKDETAQFKQSASVKWIADHTSLSLQHSYWLCVILNFAVIGGVIVWAARKTLPAWSRARTVAIQKAMQEAQKASEEARGRLADIESRLARLDSEIAAIRAAAEKEGVAEAARIQAAAKEEAAKLVAAAEQEIAAATKAARRQLTEHAAGLAVALARKQIRVDATTDQGLVRSFSQQLTSDAGKDRN